MIYSHLFFEHSFICCSVYIVSSTLYLVLNSLFNSSNFFFIPIRSNLFSGLSISSSSKLSSCFFLIFIIFSLIFIQSIVSKLIFPLSILFIFKTTLIIYLAKFSVLSSNFGLPLLFNFFFISDEFFFMLLSLSPDSIKPKFYSSLSFHYDF